MNFLKELSVVFENAGHSSHTRNDTACSQSGTPPPGVSGCPPHNVAIPFPIPPGWRRHSAGLTPVRYSCPNRTGTRGIV